MLQILINLLLNAIHAAPQQGRVALRCVARHTHTGSMSFNSGFRRCENGLRTSRGLPSVSSGSARGARGPPLQLSEEAEHALREHAWPGNVCELRHTLERACIFCDGPRLTRADIFPATQVDEQRCEPEPTLESYLEGCERRYIERALEVNEGRIVLTAQHLGISRKSLWELMRRLSIGRPDTTRDD